jgi:hypothetical protein
VKKIGIYLLFCLLIVAGARAIAYSPFSELLFIFGALSGLSIEWMAFTIWPETAKKVRYQPFYNFIGWSATLIFTASLILKGAMSGLETVIERESTLYFLVPMMLAMQTARFLRQQRQAKIS